MTLTIEQKQAINDAIAEIDVIEQQITKRRIIERLATLEAAANIENGWATLISSQLEEQREIIRANEDA